MKIAIGKSREGFQTNVNPDSLIGRRQVFGFDFLAETCEPFAIDSPHCAGFEFSPRLAVEFSLHLPNLGETDTTVSDLETIVLRERDAVVLAFAFDPGEAWSLAFGNPVEERLKCELDAVNHILEDLRVYGFEFGVVFL